MVHSRPKSLHIKATVTDVLPALGMAYLTGEDGKDWTVTKGTLGSGLLALKPGVHVDLTVQQHQHFAWVLEYAARD